MDIISSPFSIDHVPRADECAGCRGACCERVLVPITGYDAWRIAEAGRCALETFCTVASVERGSRGAFRLAGEFVALVLRHGAGAQSACYFLSAPTVGPKRCRVHSSRPQICRSYPMQLRDGVVELRTDVACEPGDWNLALLSQERWRTDLRREASDWQDYDRALGVWNDSDVDGLEAFGTFVLGTCAGEHGGGAAPRAAVEIRAAECIAALRVTSTVPADGRPA